MVEIFVQYLSNFIILSNQSLTYTQMITYKAIVISNHKKQDGTYPVKIRVYFNGKNRRLPTTLVCEQKDLTRTLKIKNKDILEKADELIRRMRKITGTMTMTELEHRDVDWVVMKIKDGLSDEHFHLDFFEWADKYIITKRPATRAAYTRALNAFERFLGERELEINDINKMMLLDFMEFIDNEPKMHYDGKLKEVVKTEKKKVAKAASSQHLMKLQHIFNAAKDRYNDEDADHIRIPRSPFDSIKKVFPSGGKGQKALDRKIIQRMIVAHPSDKSMRRALDAYIVSFGLMGVNLADMYFATPFEGNRWIYNRLKVVERRDDKAELQVDIPPQIMPYLKRLQESDNDQWWLPVLHDMGHTKQICNKQINDGLRKWQELAKVEDFTMNSARHTWATLARAMGYDLALVNDCLCHKDNLEIGRRYAPVTWEQINAVNKALLESFIW